MAKQVYWWSRRPREGEEAKRINIVRLSRCSIWGIYARLQLDRHNHFFKAGTWGNSLVTRSRQAFEQKRRNTEEYDRREWHQWRMLLLLDRRCATQFTLLLKWDWRWCPCWIESATRIRLNFPIGTDGRVNESRSLSSPAAHSVSLISSLFFFMLTIYPNSCTFSLCCLFAFASS